MAIIVEGVLTSSAGGAGTSAHDWDLVFHMMPWRVVGSDDVPALPLRVEIPMSRQAMQAWSKKLPEQTTVELELEQLQPSTDSWSLGKGRLPITHTKGSAWLQAARKARQQPVVIRDEVLGKLVLDRKYSWFCTKLKLRGRRCMLSIEQSGGTEDRERDLRDIARARTVVARVADTWLDIEKAIVRSKLELYNDTWREDRRVLDAKQFLAKLRLESIVVGDTRVTLYFKDGGLFLGHAIEVRLSPAGKVSEICLAG